MTNHNKGPKVLLYRDEVGGELPRTSYEYVSHYVNSANVTLNEAPVFETNSDGVSVYVFHRRFNACRERLAYCDNDDFFLLVFKKREAIEHAISLIEDYFKGDYLTGSWEIVDVLNQSRSSRMTYLRYQPRTIRGDNHFLPFRHMLALFTTLLSFKSTAILVSDSVQEAFSRSLDFTSLGDTQIVTRRLLGGVVSPKIRRIIIKRERDDPALSAEVATLILKENPWANMPTIKNKITRLVNKSISS